MGTLLDFTIGDFNYKLYVPGEYHYEKEFPLLVMLHGCGQNPDDFAAGTNMNLLAEKEKFFVLYPDMNHPLNPSDIASYNRFGCWNWFLDKNQHRGEGHPKVIYEMVNEVKGQYKIDPNQVYVVGLSAGASQACILGVTYPDVFNGIGICSGLAYDAANVFFLTDPLADEARKRMEKGVPDPFQCGISAFEEMGENKKKMSVIVFQGTSDTTVHPINGHQVITQWAQTNFLVEGGVGLADITPAQVISDTVNGKSYSQQIYHDGEGEPLLELWMIHNLGHSWSGGSPNGSYTDPMGPNATEIIWNFLSKHSRKTEKIPIETLVNIPVQTQDVHTIDLYAESITNIEAPQHTNILFQDQTSDQTPLETAAELPLESTDNKLIEINANPQEQSSSETSKKKNFRFSTFFSKFKKKKSSNK